MGEHQISVIREFYFPLQGSWKFTAETGGVEDTVGRSKGAVGREKLKHSSSWDAFGYCVIIH